MNRLIAHTFSNRGYTEDYIRMINNTQHGLLLSNDELCQRLDLIHRSGRHIVVLPDFDMDGVASGILGFAGLSELGFYVSLYIPNPSDGYGFDRNTIRKIKELYPDVSAILTCDVGITCYDGIDEMRILGIESLVTDHHIPDDKSINADCVVNPMRFDEVYEHPQICGAYVLYQVLQRYADTYRIVYQQEQIRRLSVFAGIGTISDCMPLRYENRSIVTDSVLILKMTYAFGANNDFPFINGSPSYLRVFRGLHQLLHYLKPSSIDEDLVGFYIAPMFNSIKRMDGDLTKAFDVFFADDPVPAIEYLIELNNARKKAVVEYFVKLTGQVNTMAPHIYFSDASKGILGLLAQKMMSDTYVPLIVVRRVGNGLVNAFAGSGRSPAWYPCMTRCREAGFLMSGHDVAFGVYIRDEHELDRFYRFIANDIQLFIPASGPVVSSIPDFVIALDGSGDTYLDIPLFQEYLRELDKYRPFGSGFEAPNIEFRFHSSSGDWKTLGVDAKHLKITLDYGFDILCWNQAEFIWMADSDRMVVVTGRLERHEFNGVDSIQFTGAIV